MATKNVSKKPKKKGNKTLTLIVRILSLVLSVTVIVFALLFAFNILKLGMLPKRYLFPVLIIIIVLALLMSLLAIFKARKRFARNFCFIVLIILNTVYFVGNRYVVKTAQMFDNITDLTDKVANVMAVRTMADKGYTSLKDINGKNVGYAPSSDICGSEQCIDEIHNQNINIELQEYGDIVSLSNALFNGEIEAMIINDGFIGTLPEVDDRFGLITTATSSIYQSIYYTERDKSTESAPESVDVTSETFTVYISGNDNYGALSGNNRSDVNMLVTVNPKTRIVLMTSIPRDYYLQTVCQSEDACLLGQMDKLTHTGLYGIGTTEQTLENLFGIKVNYNVLANFSSLVNFVDAVGGIDVFVEEGMAVKQFYSNSTLEGVQEGWNHLNGERSLAFARERHAYSTGDNQRVLNQQQVLGALISKVVSPSILLNYSKIIDAVGGAFQTNMPAQDMQTLMKFQLAEMPKWTFESYQLQGYGDYQYCAALGSTAYVCIPYEDSVAAAIAKIQAVYNGQSSYDVEDPYAYLSEEAYAIDTTEEIQEAIRGYEQSNDVYYEEEYYDEEYYY